MSDCAMTGRPSLRAQERSRLPARGAGGAGSAQQTPQGATASVRRLDVAEENLTRRCRLERGGIWMSRQGEERPTQKGLSSECPASERLLKTSPGPRNKTETLKR